MRYRFTVVPPATVAPTATEAAVVRPAVEADKTANKQSHIEAKSSEETDGEYFDSDFDSDGDPLE